MDLKKYKGQAFTIPNILSYVRFLLIPVFIFFFLGGEERNEFYLFSLIVLIASGLTDLFDGWVARRFNQITLLGQLLDPLADKLTSITVAICLCFKMPVMIFLAVLYCLKEGAMILAGVILLQNGCDIPGSKWFGKVATFVFYLSTLVMVGVPKTEFWNDAAFVVVLVNMAMILLSFFSYIPIFWHLWDNRKKELPAESCEETN